MIKAAVYARRSQDQADIAEDQRSVTRQVDHARAYAAEKGWSVVDQCIYVDDGVSGAEFSTRPGFVRLMASLRPCPPFSVLVVSEVSRLGREQIETVYALKQLAQAGVRVWSYLENREHSLASPTDKLLMSVVAYADEVERDRARQRTHDALIRKAKAGKVAGGSVFGYDNQPVWGGADAGGQKRRLYTERAINPSEAGVVRRIFALATAGYGLRRLAVLLNDERVPAPRPRRRGGSRSWAPSSVREILHRDLYRGVIVYNRVQKRDLWGRKRYLKRPESEWIRVDAPHLRIVSDEEWAAAHARLTASRASYVKATGGLLFGRPVNSVTSPYLLTGLAMCAGCRGSMVVLTRDFKRERRPILGCGYNWHRGAAVCQNNLHVDAVSTDREVLASVTRLLARRDLIEQAVALALDDLSPPRETRESESDQLLGHLSRLEEEMERLAAAVAEGGNLPALVAALKDRDRQRAEFQNRLEALRREPQTIDPLALEGLIRERLRDCLHLLGRQLGPARQILRELLADRILFTPHAEHGKRWYEFAGTVALGGFLAGEIALPQAMVTPAGFDSMASPERSALDLPFEGLALASPNVSHPGSLQ